MQASATHPLTFTARGRLVTFSRPAVMGILNVTDDSFYDGGRHNNDTALLEHARWLLTQGTDIIDVGAASSRPGSAMPPADVEQQHLCHAVTLLRREHPDVLISVDTCRATVAQAAIDAGADIINDIGGGDLDGNMFATAAALQVPYILMHGAAAHFDASLLPSTPRDAEALVEELTQFFSSCLDQLYTLGAKDVWLDPGFGFGKSLAENHLLLRHLDALIRLFDEPMLVGLSRKRMVYQPLGLTPDDALDGTTALNAIAIDRGASILRVHDPRPAQQAIHLLATQL